MTDPLAHLYAETGLDIADPDEVIVPGEKTSIDELHLIDAPEEELDDHDVDVLAGLVKARLDAGALTDGEAVDLGLGHVDDEGELVLSATGRRVVKFLIQERAIDLGFGGLG